MKIRASQAGKLMTTPQSKKDREAGNLSQSAKSYLDEIAIEEKYGRRNVFRDDKVRKGEECEEAAITLLTKTEGDFLVKNEQMFEDDKIKGTPDVLSGDTVYDTKVPYTIFTFHNAEPPVTATGKKTMYYWQLQCYMELTGRKNAVLAYCLIDTPDTMLTDKIYRAQYQFEQGEDDPAYDDYVDELEKLHKYGDIPDEERVKLYKIEYSPDDIQALYEKIEKAEEYLKDWKL